MSFVAGQIVMWIVIAALFGFAVGWLARGRKSMPRRKKRLPR
jgi:hypothetical protein